jgi:hypothetical protein
MCFARHTTRGCFGGVGYSPDAGVSKLLRSYGRGLPILRHYVDAKNDAAARGRRDRVV